MPLRSTERRRWRESRGRGTLRQRHDRDASLAPHIFAIAVHEPPDRLQRRRIADLAERLHAQRQRLFVVLHEIEQWRNGTPVADRAERVDRTLSYPPILVLQRLDQR